MRWNGTVSFKREIFPQIPPRVEYSLTEPGKELVGPIASIRDWAVAHMERVITAREMYDASSRASIPTSNPVGRPCRNPSGDEVARMLESHVCTAFMTAIS